MSDAPRRAPWAILEAGWILGVIALGAIALLAGGFFMGPRFWLGGITTVGLAFALGVDARWRLEGRSPPSHRPWSPAEGPMLWLITAGALGQAAGAYGGYFFAGTATIVSGAMALSAPFVKRRVLALAVVLELGGAIFRHASAVELAIRWTVLLLAVWALSRLVRGLAWRAEVEQQRDAQADAARTHAAKRDFGLLTEQAPAISALPDAANLRPTVGSAALDHVERTVYEQARLVRSALGATTAAVLWREADDALRLRVYDSTRDDLLAGPYAPGAGIPAGVLRDDAPLAVAPVHPGGLPYYPSESSETGGVAVAPIRGPEEAVVGLLAVDGSEPFDAAGIASVTYGAQAMGAVLQLGQRLKAADVERNMVDRICAAMRALNGALGLDQAAAATLQAVEGLVSPDLAVLSILRDDEHVILRAMGEGADGLEGLEFTGDEGLVGHAVRYGQVLPVGNSARRKGVFTAAETLPEMQSLLIFPLLKGDGAPVGALTVAAREPGRFVHHRREMLSLIGGQLGIKLDLAQVHERLRGLASQDGLTGLGNRRTFQRELGLAIARAERRNAPLSLLIIDLDHFKPLNDTYGHPFGDTVLRAVARVIERAGRRTDLAVRYGGEEFALVLEDSDAAGAAGVAERVRAEIEALRFDDKPARVTASVGLAVHPDDASTQAELVAQADAALYTAKNRGRNQVCTAAESNDRPA